MKQGAWKLLVVAVLLACASSGWAFSLRTSVEKMLGSIYSRAIEASYPIDHDPLANDYLNRIAQPIAKATGNTDFHFRYKIVDDSDVNAFALPGGHIYVNRGLLEQATRADEIAGVVGHETAHVVKHHSWDILKKSIFADVLLSQLDVNDTASALVVGLGAQLVFLHYSREHERQADDMGALYCLRGGFDPDGLLGFMTTLLKLDSHEPSRLEALFRTHPGTKSRVQALLKRNPEKLGTPGMYVRVADHEYFRGLIYSALRNYKRALAIDPDDLRAKAGLMRAAYVLDRPWPESFGPGNYALDPEAKRWQQMFALLAPGPSGPQEAPPSSYALVQDTVAEFDKRQTTYFPVYVLTSNLARELQDQADFSDFASQANELLEDKEIKRNSRARNLLGSLSGNIQTLLSLSGTLDQLQGDSLALIAEDKALLARAATYAKTGKLPQGYLQAMADDLHRASIDVAYASETLQDVSSDVDKAKDLLKSAAWHLNHCSKKRLLRFDMDASLAYNLNREATSRLQRSREHLQAGLDRLYLAKARTTQWDLSLTTTVVGARDRALAAREMAWTLGIPLDEVLQALTKESDMGKVFLALAGARSGQVSPGTLNPTTLASFRADDLRAFNASTRMVTIIASIVTRELKSELAQGQESD